MCAPVALICVIYYLIRSTLVLRIKKYSRNNYSCIIPHATKIVRWAAQYPTNHLEYRGRKRGGSRVDCWFLALIAARLARHSRHSLSPLSPTLSGGTTRTSLSASARSFVTNPAKVLPREVPQIVRTIVAETERQRKKHI